MRDARDRVYRTVTWSALVVLATAATVMLIGDLTANYQVVCFGMTTWLIAGMTFLGRRAVINPKVIESVRQGAYDSGYEDGRRVAKPVVVGPLRDVS